ncbi:MAG: cytochrome c biogenesis heme-transporting ATPase CcmA [Sulfurifustis sp.]
MEIVDLGCARGDRPLFSGLNARAKAGELLHIVGANGTGKTTLLRTLCGLSRAAEGDVRWRGESIRALGDEYRQHLVYVGHLDGIQGELTPGENLEALRGLLESRDGAGDAAERALQHVGLGAYRSLPVKVFSQGQKRRVALARLLVTHKPLWILDEPFTALDVDSCRLLTTLFAEHLSRGGIIVLTSHSGFDIPGAAIKRLDLELAKAPALFAPKEPDSPTAATGHLS